MLINAGHLCIVPPHVNENYLCNSAARASILLTRLNWLILRVDLVVVIVPGKAILLPIMEIDQN